MQDFPANSAKARARSEPPQVGPPEKIERVTSAEVNRRKRGVGRQFRETFIGGNARMAGEYMLVEVVIPAIQDTMIDAFQGGIERLIRGETRPRRRSVASSAYSNAPHVNYQGMSTSRPPTSSSSGQSLSRRSRSRQEFDEIVISSRVEAEQVLDLMFEWLSRYGMVRVSDLYEMTGIASSHTDHKWGWTNLSGAGLKRLPRDGGFLLNLPAPEELRA